MVARLGRELGDWIKKVKELRSTNWQLQNSHTDIKYNIENIVHNIVTTMHGARWVLTISGKTLCKVNNFLIAMLYT